MVVILTISAHSNGTTQNNPRDTFDEFIKAQNQHDLVLLNNLLLDSKDFLWITKGQVIWGKDEAIKRFENLYKGTWALTPDLANFQLEKWDRNQSKLNF